MKKLITPVLNLNGSDAQSLIDFRMTVYARLDDVITAMYTALPHGRDYQHLIRNDDWTEHRRAVDEARDAFMERVAVLRQMRDDFVNDALAIQQQAKERAERATARAPAPTQLKLVD